MNASRLLVRARRRRGAPAAAGDRRRDRARAGAAARSRCACIRRRRRTRSCRARARSTRRPSASTRASAKSRSRCSSRADLQQLVLSSDIDRLVGLEGCLSGNVPASALGREGGASGPCGQLARAHTVKVVFGPGTFVNEAANQIDEQLAAQTKQAEAQAKQAEHVVTRAALRRGLSAAEAQTLGRQASKITTARFQEGLVTLALQYGLTSKPEPRQTTTSSRRSCSTRPSRAGTPKQRFAYLFPSRDAALVSVRMKRRALGVPAHAHDRADPPGGGDAAVAPEHGGSYLVTGEPVIVADLTQLDHRLDRAAADRGAAGDGGDARADLHRPPATAAAGDRAARRGADVRRAVAGGRLADDGLDRRAAGARRARGRLRDPVPVARARGGRARRVDARDARAPRGRPRRADDRHGRRGERRGDARAGALAGADGARLRRAAGRSASGSRSCAR